MENPLNIDRTGVLLKWSKNIRRWQPRYVRTQRSYFSYWKYKGAPPAPDSVPDAMINLREIARVVKHRDNFTFELYRADGEKVLVLKAETEMEFKGWSDTIETKVKYLLTQDEEEEEPELGTKFSTNAFTMLSLMSKAEVEEFANDALNEIFAESDGSLEDCIHAAEKTLRIMEELCEDYLNELRSLSGQPNEQKLILFCDRLFGQYYGGIQNRLVLEVGSTLGPSLSVEQLMEKPVSVSVDIYNFLEKVEAFYTKYASLVRPSGKAQKVSSIVALGGLKGFLPTEDTLTSAVVSIAIRDVEKTWTKESDRLDARLQQLRRRSSLSSSLDGSSGGRGGGTGGALDVPPRFSVVFDNMADMFASLRIENQEMVTYVRAKVFTSCVLYLAGCLSTLQLPKVETRADERYVLSLLADVAECPSRISSLRRKYGDQPISREIADVFIQGATRFMLDVSCPFLDRFLETDEQLPRLLPLLFTHPSWLSGDVTRALISKFNLFLSSRLEDLPRLVHDRFEARLLRAFLLRYLHQFLFGLPRPLTKLSFDDIMRILDDETKIKEWVELNGRWSNREARLEQLWVLKWVRVFLLMPPSETLSLFSEALQVAHPTVALQLYDMLRYCLKLRPDTTPSVYKPALASCAEYVAQHTAQQLSSPLPLTYAVDILRDLLPQAGTVHCTGKPWRMEEVSDESVMVSVAALSVHNTHKARLSKAASVKGGALGADVAQQPAPFVLPALPAPSPQEAELRPAPVVYAPASRRQPEPPPPPPPEVVSKAAEVNPFSEDEEEGDEDEDGGDERAAAAANGGGGRTGGEEAGRGVRVIAGPTVSVVEEEEEEGGGEEEEGGGREAVPSGEEDGGEEKGGGEARPPDEEEAEGAVSSPGGSSSYASPSTNRRRSWAGSPTVSASSVPSSMASPARSEGSGAGVMQKRHSVSGGALVAKGLSSLIKKKGGGKKKGKKGKGEQEQDGEEEQEEEEAVKQQQVEGKPMKKSGSMTALFTSRRKSSSAAAKPPEPPQPAPPAPPVVQQQQPVVSSPVRVVQQPTKPSPPPPAPATDDDNPFSDSDGSSHGGRPAAAVANPFGDEDEDTSPTAGGPRPIGSRGPPPPSTAARPAMPPQQAQPVGGRRVFGGMAAPEPPPTAHTAIRAPATSSSATPPRPQSAGKRVFGGAIPVAEPQLGGGGRGRQQQVPQPKPEQQPPQQGEAGGRRGFAGKQAGDWW